MSFLSAINATTVERNTLGFFIEDSVIAGVIMGFTSSDIKTLDGLEAVRRRPTLYIGSLDDPTVANRLLQEVLCVAIDDAVAGLCRRLMVRIARDGVADISDDGPGWPVDKDVTGKPKAERYMTTLYACRQAKKVDENVAKALCHMGLAITNAVSERCVLTTHRDGSEWRQEYRQGNAVTDFVCIGPSQGRGTQLSFKLDAAILPQREFVTEDFIQWLKANSCVLDVEVIDQRIGERFLVSAREQ